jgi:hypothetical protein
MGYVRAAWRDPVGSGVWAQLQAASQVSSKTNPATASGLSGPRVAADSGDTTVSQGEYLAAAGINRAGLKLSGHLRGRSRLGELDVAPLARAEYAAGLLTVSGYAGSSIDGRSVWSGRGQVVPFSWIRVSASAGMTPASGSASPRFASSADVAIAVRGRWISGGLRQLAAQRVLGPVALDTLAIASDLPAATGFGISAMGPIWRGWNAQTEIVRWSSGAYYRPQTQARTRMWFASQFLEKIPSGNFHLSAALTHEYRSQLIIPGGKDELQVTPGWSVYGTLLEIRISNAVISWDYRNMAGKQYDTFPGFLMPRIASFYGIRWSFWN